MLKRLAKPGCGLKQARTFCRQTHRKSTQPRCVGYLEGGSQDRPPTSSSFVPAVVGKPKEEQFVVPADVVDAESYVSYMKEYRDLQNLLLDRTRQVGAVMALYLLFVLNGKAALCCLTGCGAGYAYLSWLFRDVDNLKPGDRIPMMEALQLEAGMLQNVAKLGASYQQALQPRLLVPIGLATAVTLFSYQVSPLSLMYEGCVLAGFLSYKVALVIKVADELSAKGGLAPAAKPQLEQIEDGLDMYGRAKAKMVSPTDALPQDVQERMAQEEADKMKPKQ